MSCNNITPESSPLFSLIQTMKGSRHYLKHSDMFGDDFLRLYDGIINVLELRYETQQITRS